MHDVDTIKATQTSNKINIPNVPPVVLEREDHRVSKHFLFYFGSC